MAVTVIEQLRRDVVSDLLSMSSVSANWPRWRSLIRLHADRLSTDTVLGLGDHLSEIFLSTRGDGGREQGSLAGGGAGWEALVCWYLNFCLIGSNAIVLKKKSDVPKCVRDALRVSYSNVVANSESDLVAVTLPDDVILPQALRERRAEVAAQLGAIAASKFDDLRVAVVQCKTNWNDNAQIPMLWDIVYLAESFPENRVRVGTTQYSLSSLRSFKYSFATVPTQRDPIVAGSTAVSRVMHLSGGNYWGRPSENQVASSMKEIFAKAEIGPGGGRGLRNLLRLELPRVASHYDYFDL